MTHTNGVGDVGGSGLTVSYVVARLCHARSFVVSHVQMRGMAWLTDLTRMLEVCLSHIACASADSAPQY